jgi:hypothetical protein
MSGPGAPENEKCTMRRTLGTTFGIGLAGNCQVHPLLPQSKAHRGNGFQMKPGGANGARAFRRIDLSV